jgi:hypothetical protein
VRILIATPFLGGSGGIERHVASTIACLGERHEIDVCAMNVSSTGYAVEADHPGLRVLPPERWQGKPRRRRARRDAPYDAYLHYRLADDVQDWFVVGARMTIPCGDDVWHLEQRFDAVLLEAPDNAHLVADQSKAVLLAPPLNLPATSSVAVEGVPPEFFLTIFNPHHPRKGLGDLREVAPKSPIPFVWARSSRFADEYPSDELDGIVALDGLTQEELRFLYERCRAYVSFDHNRGFGWSLADALQYGVPTLSRGKGVMSLPGLDTRGCATFHTNQELVQLLQRDDFVRVQRELGDLTPQRFVERFEALVRVLQVVRPR